MNLIINYITTFLFIILCLESHGQSQGCTCGTPKDYYNVYQNLSENQIVEKLNQIYNSNSTTYAQHQKNGAFGIHLPDEGTLAFKNNKNTATSLNNKINSQTHYRLQQDELFWMMSQVMSPTSAQSWIKCKSICNSLPYIDYQNGDKEFIIRLDLKSRLNGKTEITNVLITNAIAKTGSTIAKGKVTWNSTYSGKYEKINRTEPVLVNIDVKGTAPLHATIQPVNNSPVYQHVDIFEDPNGNLFKQKIQVISNPPMDSFTDTLEINDQNGIITDIQIDYDPCWKGVLSWARSQNNSYKFFVYGWSNIVTCAATATVYYKKQIKQCVKNCRD